MTLPVCPFPENAQLPVSQIASFISDLMHERRSFLVSGGRVRLDVEENAGLIEEADTLVGQSFKLCPSVRERFEEDGNIVIGVRACISPCTRAKKHHAISSLWQDRYTAFSGSQ